jgi:hypothetical protein
MSDTQPDKTDRQINEQSKANLGQKDAQLEKEKDSALSHMAEKSTTETKKGAN